MLYSVLKTYKNLENHQIKGKITAVERLQERSVLLEFYPKLLESNNFINNCPVKQQHFPVKKFLTENLVNEAILFKKLAELGENVENTSLSEKPFLMIGEYTYFSLKKDLFKFDDNIWRDYLTVFLMKKQFRIFKKHFHFLEKEFRYNYLRTIKKLFYNRNIKNLIYNFNVIISAQEIFYKKFVRKILWRLFFYKFKLTKSKRLPLPVWDCNFGGLVFKIPGLFESFFAPFGFLHFKKKRKKNSKEFIQFSLKKNISKIFLIKLNYIQKIGTNKLTFIVKPKEPLKKKTPKILKKFKKKKYKKISGV